MADSFLGEVMMTRFGYLEKADRSQELGEKRADKKFLELLKLVEEKKDYLDTMEVFHRKICRNPFVTSRNTKFFYYYLANRMGSLLVEIIDRLDNTHNLDEIDRDYIYSALIPAKKPE